MKRYPKTGMALLFIVTFLLSSCHYSRYWNGRSWEHGPGMMGWFGPFGMILFWIVVIVVLIAVIRWVMLTGRVGSEGKTKESALDILKKRYAAGEITKEEFEQLKKDIE
jgi:putative membrane protein